MTHILKMCAPMTCVTVKGGGEGQRRSSSSPESSSGLGVLVIMISGKVKLTGHVSNLSIPQLSGLRYRVRRPQLPQSAHFFALTR